MKPFFLAVFLSLSLLSCSSDDTPVAASEGTKLLSSRLTSGSAGISSQYTYEGNYLKTVQTDGNLLTYEYQNGLVSRAFTQNGYYENYTYDNQQRLVKKEGTTFDEEYEYPDQHTILVKLYDGNNLIQKQTIHLANEEIGSFENEILTNGQWVFSSFRFTYDSERNPRSEWPGFDKLFFSQGLRANAYGRYHNVLSCIETTSGAVTPNSVWYRYTYNGLGFPVSVEALDEDGVSHGLRVEYFY